MNASKHRRVLSSIVVGFVHHEYVPDYFVCKNCVLHINTLLSLPGGLYCCIIIDDVWQHLLIYLQLSLRA